MKFSTSNNVFDATEMIADSWSTVLQKTIQNCFNNSIGCKNSINNENVPQGSFVKQVS